jgi:hypothetical protein
MSSKRCGSMSSKWIGPSVRIAVRIDWLVWPIWIGSFYAMLVDAAQRQQR